MQKGNPKLIVAVTGASGAIYANVLLEKLVKLSIPVKDIAVVFSGQAKGIWEYELGNNNYADIKFEIFDVNDFYAPMASGSSEYSAMIICPCSMGTLGRIAAGTAEDLISRAADVMLKERRKLILVTREMPLNLIHINNMKTVTEAGGIICPASPSFYSHPKTISDVISTVTDRALQLAGVELETYRWGGKDKK